MVLKRIKKYFQISLKFKIKKVYNQNYCKNHKKLKIVIKIYYGKSK